MALICTLTIAGAGLSGCATAPTDPAARADFEKANDPLEPMNRYFFEVNRFLDFMVLTPVSDTYRRVVPEFGRTRVGNALDNMREPIVFMNTVLQGRMEDAATTLGRFLVNTILGVGGLFDVASDFGLKAQNADFGQTLWTYGVKDGGPYLVLPVFGPSNPRDAVGLGVDTAANPVSWAFTFGDLGTANYGRAGATITHEYSEVLDQLRAVERNSVDYYTQIRSLSRQRREAQLRGASDKDNFDYGIYEDLETPAKK